MKKKKDIVQKIMSLRDTDLELKFQKVVELLKPFGFDEYYVETVAEEIFDRSELYTESEVKESCDSYGITEKPYGFSVLNPLLLDAINKYGASYTTRIMDDDRNRGFYSYYLGESPAGGLCAKNFYEYLRTLSYIENVELDRDPPGTVVTFFIKEGVK